MRDAFVAVPNARLAKGLKPFARAPLVSLEVLHSRSRFPKTLTGRLTFAALLGLFGGFAACGSDDGSDDGSGSGGRAPTAGSPVAGSLTAGSGGTSDGGTDDGGTSSVSGAGGTFSGGEAGSSAGEASYGGEGGASESPPVGPTPKQYPDVDFVYEGPEEPPLTPDGACGKARMDAVPIPLDMYVLFDRSGSMNLPEDMPTPGMSDGGGDCNVGDPTFSRWCHSINSLDSFFGSAEARGTGVALQFFPAGNCASSANPFLFACCSSGACCRGGAESTPVVALGDLPGARASLASAMNAQVPAADRTPIEAALRGMINHTARARRTGRQMMGLLITDGGPEGCQSSASSLATLVREHRTETGIPIYVVGTQGAAFSWLETIAEAGGAPEHTTHCAGGVRPCHFYSVGTGQPDVFIDVLHQIRRSAIACRFAMPTSQDGLIDPNEIALSFTPSGSSRSVRLNRVSSARACTAAGGFYYDNNRNPRNILLCPTSCADFRGGDGGSVEVLLGCQGS